MCANGAPPPIQKPVIMFRNKYTKRFLKKKKKEREAAVFLFFFFFLFCSKWLEVVE